MVCKCKHHSMGPFCNEPRDACKERFGDDQRPGDDMCAYPQWNATDANANSSVSPWRPGAMNASRRTLGTRIYGRCEPSPLGSNEYRCICPFYLNRKPNFLQYTYSDHLTHTCTHWSLSSQSGYDIARDKLSNLKTLEICKRNLSI